MPDQGSQTHAELASFGEELRREREIRGISLKEIADATKISKRFLDAIERNDHKLLPAPVFTRGFVREYARYLGLSVEEIVNRYNYAAAGDDRIEKSPHLDRLTPPPVLPQATPLPEPKKGIPAWYARIDRNVIVLVLIVAALAAVSYWAFQRKREQAEAARLDALTPATVAPAAPRQVDPAPTAPAPPDDSTLRLEIEATGSSWVDIEADGKEVVSQVLKAGERRTFEAKDRFQIDSIGNAAAVILTLNDVKVPPLGDPGEVVRKRVLDRAYLDNLRKSAGESQ